MAEVYVTRSPSTSDDNGMGLMAAIIIFALVVFGVIAYANGWLSGNPAIVSSPSPSTSNITITTPASVQFPDTTTTQMPSISTQSAPTSSLD